MNNPSEIEFLKELSETPAPPGKCHSLIEKIKSHVETENLSVTTDKVGNLILQKKGTKPSVTVNASLDEAALFITQITEKGLLGFESVAILPTVLLGKQLLVGEKQHPGVIGYAPIHLQGKLGLLEKPITAGDLHIDIGCTTQSEASKLVKLGDWATFKSQFREKQGVLIGKALDNRLNVATLIKLIKNREIPNQINAVFTQVQKSWPWGATNVAANIQSDYHIVLNSVAADDGPTITPQTYEKREESRLGEGAVLTILDQTHIADINLFNHFVQTAENNNIPHQIKQSKMGQSEGGKYQQSTNGQRVLTIGLPLRYQNGPHSIAKRKDIESLDCLLAQGIKTLPKIEEETPSRRKK